MPLYFFALDGDEPLLEANEELPDDEAAREAALRIASELNRNRASQTWVTVSDELRRLIWRVG